jgi:hypothetical protein
LDSVRTNLYENDHNLFYFGVFKPKDAKKRLRFLPKKFSAISRLSLDWPGEDEQSKMHLEA